MSIKHNKGLTIEYVMILMAIVTVFVSAIFTTMLIDSSRSGQYRHYIEKKEFIDDVAGDYLKLKNRNITLDEFTKNQTNDFNFDIVDNGNSLIISSARVAVLYVEVAKIDGYYQFVKYQYGV